MNVVLACAYVVTLVATALMLRHVQRAVRSAPRLIPLRLRFDGRPSRRQAPRALLWLAPAIFTPVVVVVGALLTGGAPRRAPAEGDDTAMVLLVMLTFVEITWLIAWQTDRMVELARKMTFRVPPARVLRASLPLLLTVAVILALAVQRS